MEARYLSTKFSPKHPSWMLALACALLVSGCGGGGGSSDLPTTFDDSLVAAADEPLLSPTLPADDSLSSQNQAAVSVDLTGSNTPVIAGATPASDLLFEDPTDLADVHSLSTLADTGIRIGFTGDIDAESVDSGFIEASWSQMQSCLGVVAAAPFIIVSSDSIQPMSNADDVLFNIDGSITATSTRFATGVTIQISALDLDGSLNRIGFNLRSVMGRFLWASANLPERDYPHECANQG